MEQRANHSFNQNGSSLQLRSKEVSEAMGNIPPWIGSWGVFLISFLFGGSMLLICSVHCVQKVRFKATISWQPEGTFFQKTKNSFLEVSIPVAEYIKIKTSKRVTLSFPEEGDNLYHLSGFRFSMNDVKANADGCVVQLPLSDAQINNLKTPGGQSMRSVLAQLEADVSIYKKMIGLLF